MQAGIEPVESCADVVDLACSVIEAAFAETDSAEVEAQNRQPCRGEDLHGVVDDLVVQGAAAERMRMADECGKGGVGAAGVENGLESSCRSVEIFDGADVRGDA